MRRTGYLLRAAYPSTVRIDGLTTPTEPNRAQVKRRRANLPLPAVAVLRVWFTENLRRSAIPQQIYEWAFDGAGL